MTTTTLARLVGSVEEFADHYWGRAPLLVSGASGRDGWPDLLTLDGVDELLSVRGLRTPFLRMAKSGQTLANSEFTTGGGVGAGVADQVADDEVFRHFVDGTTIVLQGLHRTWPPLLRFAQDLGADLGHPVQVNAYITPPQSQGFAPHYDVHDVFILQLAGTKAWTVHEPVHPWPMRDQPYDLFADAITERAAQPPLLSAVLRPGDCLYLPRGYLHSAVAQGDVCAHATVGVHTWTRMDVTRSVLDTATALLADTPEARAPLPLGMAVADPDAIAEAVQAAADQLISAVRDVAPSDVARRLAGRNRIAGRAEPVQPIAAAAVAWSLDADTPLRRRAHLALTQRAGEDHSLRLLGRGVNLQLSAQEAQWFAAIPASGSFTPRDLVTDLVIGTEQASSRTAGEPTTQDLAASAQVCRRLLLAGVLAPAEA